jgi:hypothetical protein
MSRLDEIQRNSPRKYNPELAAFLSMLIPGLGHIFSLKQYLIGSVLFIIYIIILSADEFAGFVAHLLMGTPSAFHAYIAAYGMNKERTHI